MPTFFVPILLPLYFGFKWKLLSLGLQSLLKMVESFVAQSSWKLNKWCPKIDAETQNMISSFSFLNLHGPLLKLFLILHTWWTSPAGSTSNQNIECVIKSQVVTTVLWWQIWCIFMSMERITLSSLHLHYHDQLPNGHLFRYSWVWWWWDSKIWRKVRFLSLEVR